ncbi:hypothetical protein AcW1_004882 [Taiwanofungus camphoratus]|nr:hypothetical protein AcV5_001268 [Antrodia cinnamomea]KAI0941391.1 hypothetical protein AcV7_002981 [Antrodia cinnamomea]KAI0960344.1 hypothetical protein AcW1_004882 [Antrodia cinnamomea]
MPDALKAATPLQIDLNASDAEIKRVAQQALAIHGHIDVLVNNAGYILIAPLEETSMDDFKAQFQTNFFGAISLIQGLLPSFRERRSGHIINVSSISSLMGGPTMSMYCSSKAALDAATESLSMELAPFGVRVNLIVPGYFATGFIAKATTNALPREKITGAYSAFDDITLKSALQHFEMGQVGDKDKLAARIYEVVTGTGLAKGLVESQGGKRQWVRIFLGPDCAALTRRKVDLLKENLDVQEAIWSSTDVEAERLRNFVIG